MTHGFPHSTPFSVHLPFVHEDSKRGVREVSRKFQGFRGLTGFNRVQKGLFNSRKAFYHNLSHVLPLLAVYGPEPELVLAPQPGLLPSTHHRGCLVIISSVRMRSEIPQLFIIWNWNFPPDFSLPANPYQWGLPSNYTGIPLVFLWSSLIFSSTLIRMCTVWQYSQ